MTYQQLCGALGALKTAGADLDWTAINEELKSIARLGKNPLEMNTAAEPLLRRYRDMCLEMGLIKRGELFNLDDCVPLVEKSRGRPDTMDGGRRVQVYLDAPSLATADRMGDGNMSAGIRAALASAGDLDALRQAARLALTAIDSRISTEPGPARDEDREAYEALCRVLAD